MRPRSEGRTSQLCERKRESSRNDFPSLPDFDFDGDMIEIDD